jgi:hypothetical protein
MFRIKHSSRPVIDWADLKGSIEMNPPYQRRAGIWSAEEQAYLIDSIINGFDVPKLYLADLSSEKTVALNESRMRYAVIDGKQRLEAIFAFAGGKLALNAGFQWEGNDAQLGGMTYPQLRQKHPEAARAFRDFSLDVMLVSTDDESKINDLFVRLNSSKPLTGAEVRNAMGGFVPKIVRRLATHTLFSERVRFQIKRGQDRNTAAKFLLVEFSGLLVDTKKASLDRFVQVGKTQLDGSPQDLVGAVWLSSEADRSSLERAGDRVWEVMEALAASFRIRDPLLSSQGHLTVYYWFVRENLATFNPNGFRSFLQDFEKRRALNRMRARTGQAADPALSEYTDLSRSVNDVGSLSGRYLILQREYERFEESGVGRALWT